MGIEAAVSMSISTTFCLPSHSTSADFILRNSVPVAALAPLKTSKPEQMNIQDGLFIMIPPCRKYSVCKRRAGLHTDIIVSKRHKSQRGNNGQGPGWVGAEIKASEAKTYESGEGERA
jgi:hypothetical protein